MNGYTPRDGQLDTPPMLPVTRRRPRRRRSIYHRPFRLGRLLALLGLVVLGLLSGLVYYEVHTARYAIVLHEQPLVEFARAADAEALLRQYRASLVPEAPDMVSFTEGEPEVRRIRDKRFQAMETAEALDVLRRHLTPVVTGYAISVNGAPLVMMPTRDEASEVISDVLIAGAQGKEGIPVIKERVTVHLRIEGPMTKRHVPVLRGEKALKALFHPPYPRFATVGRGGSMWSVANAHGLTVAQLKRLNPLVNPAALQPGDQLRLPDELSPITVLMRQ